MTKTFKGESISGWMEEIKDLQPGDDSQSLVEILLVKFSKCTRAVDFPNFTFLLEKQRAALPFLNKTILVKVKVARAP